ncbi:MAG: cysteine rich repeat-containing protein [Leptospiraceae bacterium]|nr:cysteine rich repeat-containing protein [Leptospiraceae bacterium]
MKKYIFIMILLLSLGLYPDDGGQILSVCKNDIGELCSKNSESNIRIIQCLLENESNLSSSCKNGLKTSLEKIRKNGSEDCKNDVKKFCSWTIPGGGRIIKCLLKNEKSLSKQCSKKLNEF